MVRENTETLEPPRALWVSFPLGRPLGIPGDADFQRKVIVSALDLLARESGPVLEDYPVELPPSNIEAEIAACPISFRRAHSSESTWTSRINEELDLLRPWHDISTQKRNGFSLSGLNNANQKEITSKLGEMIERKTIASNELVWLKRTIEELKFFYMEAMTAQPGNLSHEALDSIFWQDSVLGDALIQCHQILIKQGQEGIARIIASRQAIEIAGQKNKSREDSR